MTAVEQQMQALSAEMLQFKIFASGSITKFETKATATEDGETAVHVEIAEQTYARSTTIAEFQKLIYDHESVYDNA